MLQPMRAQYHGLRAAQPSSRRGPNAALLGHALSRSGRPWTCMPRFGRRTKARVRFDCGVLAMSAGFMPAYQLACQAGALSAVTMMRYRPVLQLSNLPKGLHLSQAVSTACLPSLPLVASVTPGTPLAQALQGAGPCCCTGATIGSGRRYVARL